MKTRALITVGAAVVGALGFVASGCGGSDSDTSPTNATQTAAASQKPSAEDAAILHDAQETLKVVRKTDSETPGATNSAGLAKWGDLVTGVEVADGSLTVKTSIFPDGDVKANQYDTRICNGFAAMINVPTRVLDSQGGEVGSCKPVSERTGPVFP